MGGISNFAIEKAFKKINDPDLLDNFVGVFLSNYMNKFVNHAAMINDSGKFPFIITNTDDSEKRGTHWWSILILNLEPIFFSLILMDLEDLSILLFKMIKKL